MHDGNTANTSCKQCMCAGKLNHVGSDQLTGSAYSLVDYNRAGQALLEIVSEPDMRSGQEAAAYGAELRRIMVFLGVSDGEMSVSAPPHITLSLSLVVIQASTARMLVACHRQPSAVQV